jgi:hypothetical protein
LSQSRDDSGESEARVGVKEEGGYSARKLGRKKKTEDDPFIDHSNPTQQS